jgi:hypothetical protein
MALLPMLLVALLDGAARTMPRDRGHARVRVCAVPPQVRTSRNAAVRVSVPPPYVRTSQNATARTAIVPPYARVT